MENSFLIGERIYLRPLAEEDLDRCMRWINDPEILNTLGRRFPMSRTLEREWLSSQYKSEKDFSLAIVLKDGDLHIGNCGLHQIDYQAPHTLGKVRDREISFSVNFPVFCCSLRLGEKHKDLTAEIAEKGLNSWVLSILFSLSRYAFLGILCVFARDTGFSSRPLAMLAQAAKIAKKGHNS